MGIAIPPFLLITAVAVAAPLITELPIGSRLPMVVIEIALGIIVGPHVLALSSGDGLVELYWKSGLSFLFFLAGVELDFEAIRGRPLSLAVHGWLLSLGLALGLAGLLEAAGFIRAPVIVAVALTTTAVSTLLPILRAADELETRFGSFLLGAGVVGEFGPVVLISVVFTREHSTPAQTTLMLTFVLIAVLTAAIALKVRPPKFLALLSRTMHASSQLPVRICILVWAFLTVLAQRLGLDMVLGAFASGMVVGLATRGEKGEPLRRKLDAIGFGFLIPMFFVTSGIRFDLGALLESARTLARLPVFLLSFLIVRGFPVLLYRRDLAKAEFLPLVLCSATALPLVVAITEIGVETGRMSTDNAAALVGAGMLSVLVFPLIAMALRRKSAV